MTTDGFVIPFDKMDADTVWVIGCGPSLDLTRPRPVDIKPTDIVITINAALRLYEDVATYQVAVDHVTVGSYATPGLEWPVWVVPPQATWTKGEDTVPWMRLDFVMPDEDYKNTRLTSGSAALILAGGLFLHPSLSIKKIIVTGLDMCDVRTIAPKPKRYQYAACLAPHLKSARELLVPDRFYEQPFRVHLTPSEAYRKQGKAIASFLRRHPTVRERLECRTFCDMARLSGVGFDAGFRGAKQLPQGAEKGKL